MKKNKIIGSSVRPVTKAKVSIFLDENKYNHYKNKPSSFFNNLILENEKNYQDYTTLKNNLILMKYKLQSIEKNLNEKKNQG